MRTMLKEEGAGAFFKSLRTTVHISGQLYGYHKLEHVTLSFLHSRETCGCMGACICAHSSTISMTAGADMRCPYTSGS